MNALEGEQEKMLPPEWFRGMKKLSVDQVKKLESGSVVYLIGADRHGEKTTLECTVVNSGIHKVLAYRDGYGYRLTKPIRNYAGKEFAIKA